jgi:hypothetical protein
MEATCLSIPNPFSYLVCAGVKDVDNRGFGTDYRGTLYIHSSGRYALRGMPDLGDHPVPVINEFNRVLNQIQEMEREDQFIGIADAGVSVFLKNENRQPASVVNEYALLADVYHQYRKDPDKPFFLVNAIIGRVELVDVVQDSPSAWAEDGYFHWVFRNAHLFAEPIHGVRTTRTGLWTYELQE